eukprot:CAMPEP_0179235776 /NCGR_PEP_ID=MMETSP0797-20121207/13586_1 /TAXON_ID=47934 /ORGANISM="Dinophysis acuminata, Strain DAEP01" /LENGTH=160 /DNA_ID=CAMNT_0020943011 /DNA_START=95 /DNA_END=575 /DNA_ORIENTATION=-
MTISSSISSSISSWKTQRALRAAIQAPLYTSLAPVHWAAASLDLLRRPRGWRGLPRRHEGPEGPGEGGLERLEGPREVLGGVPEDVAVGLPAAVADDRGGLPLLAGVSHLLLDAHRREERDEMSMTASWAGARTEAAASACAPGQAFSGPEWEKRAPKQV